MLSMVVLARCEWWAGLGLSAQPFHQAALLCQEAKANISNVSLMSAWLTGNVKWALIQSLTLYEIHLLSSCQ